MDKKPKKLYVVDMPNGISYIGTPLVNHGPESNPLVLENCVVVSTTELIKFSYKFSGAVESTYNGRSKMPQTRIDGLERVTHFIDL